MMFFCYTFLEVVVKTQHYEKTTLHDLGRRSVDTSHVPHRSGDGSSLGGL